MSSERLMVVERSIAEAYECIPVEEPQVHLVKYTHRPGYLVFKCVDETSAMWVREVIPKLEPWKGASLIVLEGENLPELHSCTMFVLDEHVLRLEATRVLTRLRVSSKELVTNLWAVLGKTSVKRTVLHLFHG